MNFAVLYFSKKIYVFFAENENEAWVAKFLEADVKKVIPRLPILRNLDMHRVPVVFLQSVAYNIDGDQ